MKEQSASSPGLPPVFIGLDLAWSRRNRTGGAVLRAGRLVAQTGLLTDDASILAFVEAHLADSTASVVAIDAPLTVPNTIGRRACDHAISVELHRYEAGAYPANRQILAYDGDIRGEVLVRILQERHGFVEAAPIPHRGDGRFVCEVFPHPAHLALFDLERTIKYKRKSGRSRAQINAEFARYQTYLACLSEAEPPLRGQETLVQIDASARRGKSLRELEESLDAVTCAYVAWYAWWHGPAFQRVYGNVEFGHILVPWPPSMARRISSHDKDIS